MISIIIAIVGSTIILWLISPLAWMFFWAVIFLIRYPSTIGHPNRVTELIVEQLQNSKLFPWLVLPLDLFLTLWERFIAPVPMLEEEEEDDE